MISYKERLPKITTFIFDVDGVLTTGEVLLLDGNVIRITNSKDAYALQYAAKMGYRTIVLTGGNSTDVKERMLSLGVTEVFLSSHEKTKIYQDCKDKYGFDDEEVLYMGDDIPDYHVMRQVGIAACPQDAAVEIKDICHYQSPLSGGKGCVRDVIEQTMRVQKKWFSAEAFTW